MVVHFLNNIFPGWSVFSPKFSSLLRYSHETGLLENSDEHFSEAERLQSDDFLREKRKNESEENRKS